MWEDWRCLLRDLLRAGTPSDGLDSCDRTPVDIIVSRYKSSVSDYEQQDGLRYSTDVCRDLFNHGSCMTSNAFFRLKIEDVSGDIPLYFYWGPNDDNTIYQNALGVIWSVVAKAGPYGR
jgi:hypothetical protein